MDLDRRRAADRVRRARGRATRQAYWMNVLAARFASEAAVAAACRPAWKLMRRSAWAIMGSYIAWSCGSWLPVVGRSRRP